jgi:hypothetical protein
MKIAKIIERKIYGILVLNNLISSTFISASCERIVPFVNRSQLETRF